MRRFCFALLALVALGGIANAQVVVNSTPTRGDVATTVSSTAPAVNATQAAGTVTITPPSGQYVYFTGLYLAACMDGTASVTAGVNVNFTTTNLSSLTTQVSIISGSTITTAPGNSLCDRVVLPFATPLRSAVAGTAVTIVPPAQQAHTSYPILATYYFAP